MAETSWTLPGTVAATADWTSPTNATTDNGVGTSASWTAGNYTAYLKCTNFGFSLPAGAAITGFAVRVDVISGSGNISLIGGLTKDGSTIYGADGMAWSLRAGLDDIGGDGFLWNGTWTKSEVETTTFGCCLYGIDDLIISGGSINIDYVAIKIFYNSTMFSSVRIGNPW